MPRPAEAGVTHSQPAEHVLDPAMLAELGEELGEAGLARLFAIFEHDFALRLAALRDATHAGDGEASMRLCHAMSGAAASVGAAALAARVREGLAGPIGEADLAAIAVEAARVVAAVGTWRRTRFGAVA
ncbi:Hpt domain-containing protein [Elioraea sp.]|uniref:Hpt domain-containing protein n=1 Tax=Elioraea sp. TaxID=2185103 RepID=UPI0025BB9F78|nr:Hpt domain-containing protein [Elioraea sp.]